MSTRTQELTVGVFVALAMAALVFLALQVSGLTRVFAPSNTYALTAHFNNIGSLGTGARVAMSGVTIGRVSDIRLDPERLDAKVTLQIDGAVNEISTDSYASIKTAGVLGEQFISIEPGADTAYVKDGDTLTLTQSALSLEDLVSQFVFNQSTKDDAPAVATAGDTPALTQDPAQDDAPAVAVPGAVVSEQGSFGDF